MKFNVDLSKDFSFKLSAHTIRVKIVGPKHPKLINETTGENDHGVFEKETYTIYLSKDDPDSVKLSTFIHETLHAIEDFYMISLKHKDLNEIGESLADVFITNFTGKK